MVPSSLRKLLSSAARCSSPRCPVPDGLQIRTTDWIDVTPYIFRSWAGKRRVGKKSYRGPVFFLGTDEVVRGNGDEVRTK